MKKFTVTVATIAILFTGCFSPSAHAESITTLFQMNNSNSIGGAVFFDMNVARDGGLTITSLGVNADDADTDVGTPFSVNIYTRTGTYADFTSSPEGWTLVSTGSGVTAAMDTPSFVDVTDFALSYGVTGIAIQNVGFSAAYTNGGNGNQIYSDSNITLTFGSAQNVLFSPIVNTPRVANLSINYTPGVAVVPEADTAVLVLPALVILGTVLIRRRKMYWV